MEPQNMTAKRRKSLRLLFARGADQTLACMSSEYCDGDEKEFKANFGVSSKEMKEAIKTLQYFLR